MRLELPGCYDGIRWYGRGPEESYCDRKGGIRLGLYERRVSEMEHRYMRPQENGSHYNCSLVRVGGMQAEGSRPFSFNASEYTIQELETKQHNYELEKCGSVIVCTDYKISGVGSNSCGPELLPQYRLDEEEFHWEMRYRFE